MRNCDLYNDLMDVLRKLAELPHHYYNPSALTEIKWLLKAYGNVEDDVVNRWVSNMWMYE